MAAIFTFASLVMARTVADLKPFSRKIRAVVSMRCSLMFSPLSVNVFLS